MKDEDPRDREKDYIPGVYNYCDQWCERCRFSNRCLNCSLDKEKLEDGPCLQEPEAFWDKLSETLQEALNLLNRIAEEEGIDLDAAVGGVDFHEEIPGDEDTLVSILTHLSETYIDKVREWFEANAVVVDAAFLKNKKNASLRVISSDAGERTLHAEDAVEIVKWYQYQIPVKLQRARSNKKEEAAESPVEGPKDSDGSAKVALLGIDRSIGAWGELLKAFPEQKKAVLNISATLTQLRERIEVEFPEARFFIRPGFDEIE